MPFTQQLLMVAVAIATALPPQAALGCCCVESAAETPTAELENKLPPCCRGHLVAKKSTNPPAPRGCCNGPEGCGAPGGCECDGCGCRVAARWPAVPPTNSVVVDLDELKLAQSLPVVASLQTADVRAGDRHGPEPPLPRAASTAGAQTLLCVWTL